MIDVVDMFIVIATIIVVAKYFDFDLEYQLDDVDDLYRHVDDHDHHVDDHDLHHALACTSYPHDGDESVPSKYSIQKVLQYRTIFPV